MNKNVVFRRRISIHEQLNRISIFVSLILIICIYLTINSIENKNLNEILLINSNKISICPQLSSSTKGYFRVEFVTNSTKSYPLICKSNDTLLVYILSTSKNFQRRESIRQTWSNKKKYSQLNTTCFIFLVGLSININDSNLPYSGDIKYESLIYNDIVQLNITETYQNVVYKEVGALKWSYLYASHIPFLFKTDDDLIIDTILLTDIVQFLITNKTNHSLYLQKHQAMKDFIQQMYNVDKYTLFKGKDLGGISTFRTGKFGIHQLAWNYDKLPPYCSGFGFIFSSFIRDRLYRASLCYGTEYVPLVGDVFVSGFLAGAASVRCSNWAMINIQAGENCGKLFQQHSRLLVCSTPLHRGKQTFIDFYIGWKEIINRHGFNTNHIIIPTTTTTISNKFLFKNFLNKSIIIQNKISN